MRLNIRGEEVEIREGWRMIFLLKEKIMALTDRHGRIAILKIDPFFFIFWDEKELSVWIARYMGENLFDLEPVEEARDPNALTFLLQKKQK